MAEEEDVAINSEMDEKFSRAANQLQSMVSKLESAQLLEFYGLYKQATVGPCDTAKPSWYQTQAKYKWEAWKALNDMSKEDAMINYMKKLTEIDPDWEQDSHMSSKSWIAVSTLPNTDIELSDEDKKLLDWIKDKNETKVRELLNNNSKVDLNVADEDGMMPLHWAADRGSAPIIQYLVENGADVNAQDDAGQTALHYSASCGHTEAVKYLLSVGAELLKDDDGRTPKDVADPTLITMF